MIKITVKGYRDTIKLLGYLNSEPTLLLIIYLSDINVIVESVPRRPRDYAELLTSPETRTRHRLNDCKKIMQRYIILSSCQAILFII